MGEAAYVVLTPILLNRGLGLLGPSFRAWILGVRMVNILDVAREAGVSKTTVSYVISGNSKISRKTTDKVRKAMRKLGYTVNHSARALSTSRTMTLGVATSDIEDVVSSPLLKGIYFTGLSSHARKLGYDLLLMVDEDGRKEIEDAALARKIDGLILMDVNSHDNRVATALAAGIPTVLFGMPEQTGGMDVVDTNFEQAAADLVTHFALNGHRRILLISSFDANDPNPLNYSLRFARSANMEAERNGLRIEREWFGGQPGWSLRRAIQRHPGVTGVIVEDQEMAVGARMELTQEEVAVPGGISVAVLLADVVYEKMRMPVSTVTINTRDIASAVVDTLLWRIEHPGSEPRTTLVNTTWHEEGSILNL